MGARDDTLALLRDGLSRREISKHRGVTIATTLGYLNQLVGEGRVRRSDILHSIPRETRTRVMSAIERTPSGSLVTIYIKLDKEALCKEDKIPREDTEVVWRYRDARVPLGDMYEDLRQIEVWLHQFLKAALQEEFGPGEQGWWQKGIPLAVRQDCQARREEDNEPASEVYSYTTLVNLTAIIDKNWAIVSKHLPGQAASNRGQLLANLLHLNQIRNKVMHPVRGNVPTEEDFEFVQDVKALFGPGQR